MRQVYAPWRDEQSKARFPFDDGSNLVSFEQQTLSDALIVDAAIHPPGLTGLAYLTTVTSQDSTLTFSITDAAGRDRCSGKWPVVNAEDPAVVPLLTPEGAAAGLLVLNPREATSLLRSFQGSMNFAQSSARFVPSVVSFVSSNSQTNVADGVQLPESGDVYLVGSHGVQLQCETRVETISGETLDVNYVRVNAVGDPLGRRSECGTTKFETPRFIREVVFQKDGLTHVCSPSGLGEIFIMSASITGKDSALRSYAEGNSISFGLAGRASDTTR